MVVVAREAGIALRTVLMRLISPSALTRLALPAVLTRLVAPLLAGAAVVPASSTSSSSLAVAPVVALGVSTEAPIADGPELLTVAGVVAVYVVEGAERSAALGRVRVVKTALHLWLGRKHGCTLALHILGLSLLVLWVGS